MEIIIHSFPMCGRCKTVKMLLDKYNVKYDDMMVSEVLKDGGEYPLIFIDGKEVEYHAFLQSLRKGDIK